MSWREKVDQAAAPEPGRRTWRTYAEIRAATAEKPREWLIPGLLPLGGVIVVAGYAKRSGKSTLAWALAAARERGGLFLGAEVERGPVVIVAEDADLDLADRIERFGFPEGGGCVLSRAAVEGGWTIEEVAREAGEHARVLGARVVIVDTFLHWARLPANAENDAGSVTEALRPLQRLADERGALVVVVHHAGKNRENEGGYAGRGSSAFAGVPEATWNLRDAGGAHPRRRQLVIDSRVAEVGLREVVIELKGSEDGLEFYDLVGDAGQIGRESVDGRILAWLRGPGASAWHTRPEVVTGVGGRGGDVESALPRLYRGGRVARIGAGRAGDPHHYAALGTPSPTSPTSNEASQQATAPQGSPSAPGSTRTDDCSRAPGGSIEPGSGERSSERARPIEEAHRSPGAPDGNGAPRCPVCRGPTRPAGRVRLCAGRCAAEAGAGGLVPVVPLEQPNQTAAPAAHAERGAGFPGTGSGDGAGHLAPEWGEL
ncbi:MAG: AAA family ATPase [Dehalococcoidia bacterium]